MRAPDANSYGLPSVGSSYEYCQAPAIVSTGIRLYVCSLYLMRITPWLGSAIREQRRLDRALDGAWP